MSTYWHKIGDIQSTWYDWSVRALRHIRCLKCMCGVPVQRGGGEERTAGSDQKIRYFSGGPISLDPSFNICYIYFAILCLRSEGFWSLAVHKWDLRKLIQAFIDHKIWLSFNCKFFFVIKTKGLFRIWIQQKAGSVSGLHTTLYIQK